MSPTKKAAPARPAARTAAEVVETLRRMGSKKERDGMARYAIPSDNAFGIAMGALLKLAKEIGPDHRLALGLWASGEYESKTLAALVGEPEQLTPALMDRWASEFDNWAICDTVCFTLFDRSPHAFGRIEAWAKRREENVKRGAFALLASVALHDKQSGDERFRPFLRTLEEGAADDRNFVKKGVLWALRGVAGRSRALHTESIALAKRLAASDDKAPRWIGKAALRELSSTATLNRLAAQEKRAVASKKVSKKASKKVTKTARATKAAVKPRKGRQ